MQSGLKAHKVILLLDALTFLLDTCITLLHIHHHLVDVLIQADSPNGLEFFFVFGVCLQCIDLVYNVLHCCNLLNC